ncbi:MAG: HAD family hydrolase [Phycisphaerales bacterium]|nr:HAD family hydrolase [Phycisphaerales bacterium]
MLILFDIDGTLLRTQGAGIAAMLRAAQELHPEKSFSMDGILISGRLDSLIWRDLMGSAGVDPNESNHADFRECYGRHLRSGFNDSCRSEPLPGARALVERLASEPEIALGLLTGNYEHTGRLKVERAGIPVEVFQFNAWADDGSHRRDLPPIAMERFREHSGVALRPGEVVIVGDTPLDIDCAHANGCQVVAVATGAHDLDELRNFSPDHLLENLSDTDAIALWMTGRNP